MKRNNHILPDNPDFFVNLATDFVLVVIAIMFIAFVINRVVGKNKNHRR